MEKMRKEMEHELVLLKLSKEIRDDVNKNNENSKENLNNNEQKKIQIQNVQEQRDLDINKYRKDTQNTILQIIENNKNNEDNKDTIDYISSILLRYNQLTDTDKYSYRSAKDDKTREKLIPKHIERVVTIKSKLSDEVTSNFIKDVQKEQITNNELNNIITNYINYLKTQNINVMTLFDKNVKDNIQNTYLFNNIRNKVWMVSIGRHPDSDPNSLGTGDR